MVLAARIRNEEKRIYLRNIILNAAEADLPDFSLSQIFLSYIESFTIWHIKILSFSQEPNKFFEERNIEKPKILMGTYLKIILSAFPELEGKEDLIKLIWEDLKRTGLVASSISASMHEQALYEKGTTELGDLFIDLILK